MWTVSRVPEYVSMGESSEAAMAALPPYQNQWRVTGIRLRGWRVATRRTSHQYPMTPTATATTDNGSNVHANRTDGNSGVGAAAPWAATRPGIATAASPASPAGRNNQRRARLTRAFWPQRNRLRSHGVWWA